METNVSYTVAGAFILVLTGFIVFAVVWLSAGFSTKDYEYYTVYMKESISGLSKDGPVEFNGVNVGKVKEMKISQKNPQLVILTLEVETDTPITQGTRAKLGMRALTGVAYMLLEDKGKDRTPLALLQGQRYPVIETTPSILVRLDTILTQMNESFTKVGNSVAALLNKKNLAEIQQILVSGRGSLQVLETQTIPVTNQAINNFSKMTRDLRSVTSEIKDNPSIIIRGKAPRSKLGPGER